MTTYRLHISFKSNEFPWTTIYVRPDFWEPLDEAGAIKWAYGMQEGLGPDYTVVLYEADTLVIDASKERPQKTY